MLIFFKLFLTKDYKFNIDLIITVMKWQYHLPLLYMKNGKLTTSFDKKFNLKRIKFDFLTFKLLYFDKYLSKKAKKIAAPS